MANRFFRLVRRAGRRVIVAASLTILALALAKSFSRSFVRGAVKSDDREGAREASISGAKEIQSLLIVYNNTVHFDCIFLEIKRKGIYRF